MMSLRDAVAAVRYITPATARAAGVPISIGKPVDMTMYALVLMLLLLATFIAPNAVQRTTEHNGKLTRRIGEP
jgi:hypothetical protein